jgi:hypothetical protein
MRIILQIHLRGESRGEGRVIIIRGKPILNKNREVVIIKKGILMSIIRIIIIIFKNRTIIIISNLRA